MKNKKANLLQEEYIIAKSLLKEEPYRYEHTNIYSQLDTSLLSEMGKSKFPHGTDIQDILDSRNTRVILNISTKRYEKVQAICKEIISFVGGVSHNHASSTLDHVNDRGVNVFGCAKLLEMALRRYGVRVDFHPIAVNQHCGMDGSILEHFQFDITIELISIHKEEAVAKLYPIQGEKKAHWNELFAKYNNAKTSTYPIGVTRSNINDYANIINARSTTSNDQGMAYVLSPHELSILEQYKYENTFVDTGMEPSAAMQAENDGLMTTFAQANKELSAMGLNCQGDDESPSNWDLNNEDISREDLSQ